MGGLVGWATLPDVLEHMQNDTLSGKGSNTPRLVPTTDQQEASKSALFGTMSTATRRLLLEAEW